MNSVPASASAKVVVQVPWGHDPGEVLSGWPLGLDRLVLNVRLAAGNPALPNFDEQAILKLLTYLSEICASNALGKIRTPDPQIRSLVLYPAELRALCPARGARPR